MTAKLCMIILPVIIAGGCASMSRQRIEDITPLRVYHRPYKEVFEVIKLYSFREGFVLDRYGEEAGRIIGHKATSSSGQDKQFSRLSENTTLLLMYLKLKKTGDAETEVLVNFAFEQGHVALTAEEEAMLLDCYNTFFTFMQDQVGG